MGRIKLITVLIILTVSVFLIIISIRFPGFSSNLLKKNQPSQNTQSFQIPSPNNFMQLVQGYVTDKSKKISQSVVEIINSQAQRALTLLPFKQKVSGPQKISMPYHLDLTIPAGWSILKKPLVNQYVFTNGQKGDSACYLDVFVVRPDRDYSFSQWLGTAIDNQTFLQNGKQTTFKGKDMFVGAYYFVDDYFKQQVNNQRAILKSGGTLVDLHMSYKTNQSCLKDFQQILDSVNF